MDVKAPRNFISDYPITAPAPESDGKTSRRDRKRRGFIQSLSTLFGFRKKDSRAQASKTNIEFTKVDLQNQELRVAQAKLGKILTGKLSTKLETLFDAWLSDTAQASEMLRNRMQRLADLEFAINNDPFLSQAADLYADEATQLDVQDKLITIECPDVRMKKRMEDLLEQWGVTQNRVRAAVYQMAAFGDAFWSLKVTEKGVIRINPLTIYQVKDRLEFSPIQVATDIAVKQGALNTAVSRYTVLQQIMDEMEQESASELSDLFDTKLFGFALEGDQVAPPWAVAHFRLSIDQSEFFPFGKSVFLKALAPFRQCNATMVLQSLARVKSFPITTYEVTTTPGMDESQIFEKINDIREEYEGIGEVSTGGEAMSINTTMWLPKDLITLTVHNPQIDLDSIGDIEMYQDRVAIASGIPKGYLVQEWGGWGNSALSLTEQHKPFGRKVYTVQSGFIQELSNMFRLHFSITGEFDYRAPFALSMRFPNEESSADKRQAKGEALELSKNVIDTVSNIIGAINAPLPQDVVQDILTKFSFLDPEDVKKWVKVTPGQKVGTAVTDEPFNSSPSASFGNLGSIPSLQSAGAEAAEDGGDGESPFGGGADAGGDNEFDLGDLDVENNEVGGEEEFTADDLDQEEEKTSSDKHRLQESVIRERYKLLEKDSLYEAVMSKVMKKILQLEEVTMNNRHFKVSSVDPCMEKIYESFANKNNPAMKLRESASISDVLEDTADEMNPDYTVEQQEDDEIRQKNLSLILSR